MEHYSELPSRAQCNRAYSEMEGGGRSDRKREVWPQRSDVACRARRQPFLALKTEEGALSQGMQAASRSWKRQEMNSF